MDAHLDRRLSDLMRKAQDGDRVAYEALLTDTTRLVRAFVGRRVVQADQVEDVVQETLLSIHHYRHTYDPARPFGPWMYTIARHRMIDHLTAMKRRRANEVLSEGGVEELAAPVAGEGILGHALALLSGRQREVIHLMKVEGWSVAEIAQKTGRSAASVKVTAHRGYLVLRKLMGRVAREG